MTSSGRPNPADTIRAALIRFGVLFALLLVVFPVAIAIMRPADVFWGIAVEQANQDRLQPVFGFVLESQVVTIAGGRRERRGVIASVTPGGTFALRGFRPRDVLGCRYQGRGNFWRTLLEAEDAYESEVEVIGHEDLVRGCDGSRIIRFEGRKQLRSM